MNNNTSSLMDKIQEFGTDCIHHGEGNTYGDDKLLNEIQSDIDRVWELVLDLQIHNEKENFYKSCYSELKQILGK